MGAHLSKVRKLGWWATFIALTWPATDIESVEQGSSAYSASLSRLAAYRVWHAEASPMGLP